MRIVCAAVFTALFATTLSSQNFRVQVSAFADPKPPSFFRELGLDSMISTHDPIGVYRYFYAGSFPTYEAAEPVLKAVRAKGFPRAFILDLEEQRVLTQRYCPYFRDGFIMQYDTSRNKKVHNLFFGSGQYQLSPEAKQEIDLVVDRLKANINLRVGILAYTDNVGDAQFNVELGANRARSARDYLVAKGVRADRMYIRVYGEAQPIAPNFDESDKPLPNNQRINRRVALFLYDATEPLKTDAEIQEIIQSSPW